MKNNKARGFWIVGDATNEKPIMIVEYIRGNNNYVKHKILKRFFTREEAEEELKELTQ